MKRLLSDLSYYYYTGVLLLLAVLLPYFISFDYLIVNSQGLLIHGALEILILCTIGFAYFVFRNEKKSMLLTATLTAFVFGAICWVLNHYVYDFSFDGQGYHQDAIITFSSGWNYFYDVDSSSFHERWIDFYPKASWVSSSFYFGLLGSISAAKCTNLMLVFSSVFLSIPILYAHGIRSVWTIGILSLALGFDPTNLNGFFSFMNDGQISSILLLLFLVILYYRMQPSNYKLVLIGMCVVYCINLKFSAGIYAVMLTVSFLLFEYLTAQLYKYNKLYVSLMVAIILGFGLWGYNPYVSNVKNQGHPFYPVFGNELLVEEALGNDYLPSNFDGANAPLKVLKSIFSQTSFSESFKKEAKFKLPFFVEKKELATYAGTGVMLGGMGPIFSGLFILSVLVMVLLLYFLWDDFKKRSALILIGGMILVSVFCNPMGWWFRFVPQFWYFIIVMVVILIGLEKPKVVLLQKMFLSLVCLNLILMGGYILYQPIATIELNKQLTVIKQDSANKEISIDFGQHELSFQRKLEKYNIKHHKINFDKYPCGYPRRFKLLDIKLCIE